MVTITRVLDATSEFIKVLRWGRNDVNTPEQALPFGVDSKPIKNKRGIVLETSRKGKNIIIAYLIKSEKTESGELRTYSTDDDGVEKFYIYHKKDGTCEIGGNSDNMVRYSELKSGFDQLKSDFNAFVTAYNTHTHLGVTVGTGATAVPVSLGSQSTADISNCKIDEIKTL